LIFDFLSYQGDRYKTLRAINALCSQLNWLMPSASTAQLVLSRDSQHLTDVCKDIKDLLV
jgi:predicted Rdx family selenoprotein